MFECLEVIGAVTVLCVSVFAVIITFEFIKDAAHELKRIWRYKHRFDKPPTAKCYCIDCNHHDNETGRCYRFHGDHYRCTANNCFCYEAEPRKE